MKKILVHGESGVGVGKKTRTAKKVSGKNSYKLLSCCIGMIVENGIFVFSWWGRRDCISPA